MISTQRWPQPAIRAWTVAQRFQKFLVVGAAGLAVNQGLLFVFRDSFGASLTVASPTAIFISMIVTFVFNEIWTWHDRGSGPLVHRVLLYFPINSVGLVINFGVLSFLVHQHGWHYLIANLVGAGVAAVWNFVVNHFVTWRS